MKSFSLALLSAVGLLAARPALGQACKCSDAAALQTRETEAKAAIAAYQTEIQKMAEQMMRTQQPLPYTPERREKLQGRVKGAIQTALAGTPSPAATTDGKNPGGTSNLCAVEINPTLSPCMHDSISAHEQYHADECLKTRSAGTIASSVLNGSDRFERDHRQLAEYASEEIGGYTKELMFISSELARLKSAPECAPKPPPTQKRDYTAQPRQP